MAAKVRAFRMQDADALDATQMTWLLFVAHLADPSIGPEQNAVDADTTRTLGRMIATLPPGRRTLVRALFTDSPRPYREWPAAPESRSAVSDRAARVPLVPMRRMLVERGLTSCL